MDKRITFELEGERSFYNFDLLLKSPKQFLDFVNDQIDAADETNHLLFVCLSNSCELPKQDPYFSSMVTPLKNIYSFKVNAFEGVELIGTYPTGQDVFEEKVINYPYYLRSLQPDSLARLSYVYMNAHPDPENPSSLTVFLANCQNVLFQSCQDPLFSQVTHIFYFIEYRDAQNLRLMETYFRRLTKLQRKVLGELLQHSTIRNKMDIAEEHNTKFYMRYSLLLLRKKIRRLYNYGNQIVLLTDFVLKFYTYNQGLFTEEWFDKRASSHSAAEAVKVAEPVCQQTENIPPEQPKPAKVSDEPPILTLKLNCSKKFRSLKAKFWEKVG